MAELALAASFFTLPETPSSSSAPSAASPLSGLTAATAEGENITAENEGGQTKALFGAILRKETMRQEGQSEGKAEEKMADSAKVEKNSEGRPALSQNTPQIQTTLTTSQQPAQAKEPAQRGESAQSPQNSSQTILQTTPQTTEPSLPSQSAESMAQIEQGGKMLTPPPNMKGAEANQQESGATAEQRQTGVKIIPKESTAEKTPLPSFSENNFEKRGLDIQGNTEKNTPNNREGSTEKERVQKRPAIASSPRQESGKTLEVKSINNAAQNNSVEQEKNAKEVGANSEEKERLVLSQIKKQPAIKIIEETESKAAAKTQIFTKEEENREAAEKIEKGREFASAALQTTSILKTSIIENKEGISLLHTQTVLQTEGEITVERDKEQLENRGYFAIPSLSETFHSRRTVTLNITPAAEERRSQFYTAKEPSGKTPQKSLSADTMINQLQKIIDNSSETETVRIEITQQSQRVQNIESRKRWKPQAETISDSTTSHEVMTNKEAAAKSTTLEIESKNISDTVYINRAAETAKEKSAVKSADNGENRVANNKGNSIHPASPLAGKEENKEAGSSTKEQNSQESQSKNGEPLHSRSSQNTHLGRNIPTASRFEIAETRTSLPAENTSGQFSTAVPSAQPVPTEPNAPLQSAQTITLPSGIVVREEEVVRQFIERFQINSRTIETRINIRLNPAELGKLNVTLTVKEGTVQASVIAQSVITRDIIEKNFDRLRTSLKQQGFTLDDFVVTVEEEIAESAALFQEFAEQSAEENASQQESRNTPPALFSYDEERSGEEEEAFESEQVIVTA